MFIKGRFVVGCTDVMIGGLGKEDGCFLRIFYPTKLTDTYVGTQTWHQQKVSSFLKKYHFFSRKIQLSGRLGYRTKNTKKVTQSFED